MNHKLKEEYENSEIKYPDIFTMDYHQNTISTQDTWLIFELSIQVFFSLEEMMNRLASMIKHYKLKK